MTIKENIVCLTVMGHCYTQLYIVPLCHFKMMLFNLENALEVTDQEIESQFYAQLLNQVGFQNNNSSIKCIPEIYQKCSLIMIGASQQYSTRVIWKKNCFILFNQGNSNRALFKYQDQPETKCP